MGFGTATIGVITADSDGSGVGGRSSLWGVVGGRSRSSANDILVCGTQFPPTTQAHVVLVKVEVATEATD